MGGGTLGAMILGRGVADRRELLADRVLGRG